MKRLYQVTNLLLNLSLRSTSIFPHAVQSRTHKHIKAHVYYFFFLEGLTFAGWWVSTFLFGPVVIPATYSYILQEHFNMSISTAITLLRIVNCPWRHSSLPRHARRTQKIQEIIISFSVNLYINLKELSIFSNIHGNFTFPSVIPDVPLSFLLI